MPIRQYNANRYQSSQAVQDEFENLIRYIAAAELGGKTLKELLGQVFDDEGDIDLSLKFRYDAIKGLEVAVGEDSDEWTTVVAADDIRGAPGVSLGTIDGPVFFNRVDLVATEGQVSFPYFIASDTADVVIYVNGILQAETSYSYSSVTNTVTTADPQSAGTKVTIYSIRNNGSSTYRRTDFLAGASQVVFPFPHTAEETVQVYRNGILQREGASFDFIQSAETGTITMTTAQPANTLISAVVVQNDAIRDVLGLMLEDRYATDGLIRFDRIAISDGQIATEKVAGLVASLALKGDTYVAPAAPTGARAGSMWINTSRPVPQLLFYDGTRWLDPSPEGLLPVPTSADALRFLRLNSTATAFELVTLDFSGLVATSLLGASGGVAQLDGSGTVPVAQTPLITRRRSISGKLEGAIANGTKVVGVLGGQRYMVDAATYVLEAGSATVQLRIGGTDYGLAVAVGTVPVTQQWAGVVADAIAAGLAVSLVITLAAGASGLSWNVQSTITA